MSAKNKDGGAQDAAKRIKEAALSAFRTQQLKHPKLRMKLSISCELEKLDTKKDGISEKKVDKCKRKHESDTESGSDSSESDPSSGGSDTSDDSSTSSDSSEDFSSRKKSRKTK